MSFANKFCTFFRTESGRFYRDQIILGLMAGISLFFVIGGLSSFYDEKEKFIETVFIVVFTWSLALTLPCNDQKITRFKALLGSFGFAAFITASAAWERFGGSERSSEAFAVLGLIMIAFVGLGYIQCILEQRKLCLENEDLLQRWAANATAMMIAYVFVGAVQLLLLLWAQLFLLLEISFFSDLFSNMIFQFLITPMAMATGLAAARQKEQIVTSILRRGSLLGRFLLPLASIVALAFLLALCFKGLDFLWKFGRSTPLLLTLALLLLFLSNSAAQIKVDAPSIPRFFQIIAGAALIVLPVYMLIALYGMWLRIDQHGLTPSRLEGVIAVLAMLACAVAYAWAAVKSKPGAWLAALGRLNPILTFMLLLTTWLLSTPILPLERIAVNNQVARLMNGAIGAEKFDYRQLKRWGGAGEEAFAALAETARAANHPEADIIATKTREPKPDDSVAPIIPPVRDIFENVLFIRSDGDSVELARERFKKIFSEKYFLEKCRKEEPCLLIFAKPDRLNPDQTYYLWFDRIGSQDGWLYQVKDDVMIFMGKVKLSQPVSPQLAQQLYEAPLKQVEPRFADLQSGDVLIRIIEK